MIAEQEQEKSVLEFSLLHKIMLFFDTPADWPGWAVGFAAALLACLVSLVWWLLGQSALNALLAGSITLAFLTFDALTFASLPRRGLSYGNWKTQAFFVGVPRLAAAAGTGRIWGPPPRPDSVPIAHRIPQGGSRPQPKRLDIRNPKRRNDQNIGAQSLPEK